MGYVEFTVPEGTADGIARFYREVFYAPACVKENGEGRAAHVGAGYKQELVFRETDQKIPEFDGHHLQVYAQEFSGPHDELEKRGLITEESDQYQYRWQDIVLTGAYRFPAMESVVFGRPFAEALAQEVDRLEARAVFILASGTLARETDTVDRLSGMLGNRLAGVCAKIGAHTPRTDVVAA